MDLTKIKNDIPKSVYEYAEKNVWCNSKCFVSVLSYRYGEIVERSFAIYKSTKKGVLITEVRRRATGKSGTVVKNLLYGRMCGYIPVFKAENRYSNSGGYSVLIFGKKDFDVWYEAGKPCCFYCHCLNPELLFSIEEFKYCGYSNGDVILYLNEYRKNPMVEFLGKFDLPISPLFIKQAEKDKKFKTFLVKHIDDVRYYGSQATIYAYKNGMDIAKAYTKIQYQKYAAKQIPALKGQKSLNGERIIEYCKSNDIDFHTYSDYLKAVIALKLDLTDTKNIYPKDFNTLHDLRISEYESQKAKLDEEERKAFYKSFAKAGEKATAYEYTKGDYSIIAPKDISELVTEGETLNHCVGKSGYDKKMADNEIVIMFVRKKNEINQPFVTIEYDLKQSKLKQAYAKSNTKPPNDVMVFLDKWVIFMNKILKQQRANKLK